MLKKYKPITPSLRHVCLIDKKLTSSFSPVKYLITNVKKMAGRNHHGHITVRHQGSGVKSNYKMINYIRKVFQIQKKYKYLLNAPIFKKKEGEVVYLKN